MSVRGPAVIRSFALALAILTTVGPSGCSLFHLGKASTDHLLTREGLSAWETEDARLRDAFAAASEQYRQTGALEDLRAYEKTVQQYLDHGFTLYRTYHSAHRPVPDNLQTSLQARTGYLMDVADEYLKHGSLAMGVGLAAEIVKDYSDLPVMAPAQRRAHHVLDEYRNRQDYGP